ncbi:hypothetical protein BC833DRAFT_132825 [Globomyces pollinis-pini]|nr:hypothetical protein BC833DRAFT_132825 [Globomyces pollinis-pini]
MTRSNQQRLFQYCCFIISVIISITLIVILLNIQTISNSLSGNQGLNSNPTTNPTTPTSTRSPQPTATQDPRKKDPIFSFAIPTRSHQLITSINDTGIIDSKLFIKVIGGNQLYGGMASSKTDLRNPQTTIFHGACMFKGVTNNTNFQVTHGNNTAIFKYAMYELNGDQTTYTFSNSTYRLLYRLAIHMDNFVGLAIFDTVKTISMDDSFWLAVKQSSAEVADKQFETDYFSITDATIEIVNYLKSNDSTYQPGNEVILKYWDCYIFGFRLLNKLGIKIETMYKPLVGDIDVHQQVLKSFTNMNITDTKSFSGYPFAIPVNDGYGRLLMDPNGNDLLNKLVSWQNTPAIEATVESDIPILSVPMDAPIWLYHWGVFVMQSYVVYPLY